MKNSTGSQLLPKVKFAFVADTNLFSDAYLVSAAAVGYKPESAFVTQDAAVSVLTKPLHLGAKFHPV